MFLNEQYNKTLSKFHAINMILENEWCINISSNWEGGGDLLNRTWTNNATYCKENESQNSVESEISAHIMEMNAVICAWHKFNYTWE